MKKILAALLCSMAFAAPAAFAQNAAAPAPAAASAAASAAAVDPTTAAAVKEMLEVMKYREMMQASFNQMRQSMPGMLQNAATTGINNNAQLNAKQKKAALAKAQAELPKALAAIDGMFGDGKLIDELIAETVPLYARHFTTAEIREMTAYYKTPLGQKQMALMPQIMAEANGISQRLIMPRLGAMVEQLTKAK